MFALGMMWDEEKEQPKRLDLRIQQKQKIIEKHKLQGSQKMLANETRFPAVMVMWLPQQPRGLGIIQIADI